MLCLALKYMFSLIKLKYKLPWLHQSRVIFVDFSSTITKIVTSINCIILIIYLDYISLITLFWSKLQIIQTNFNFSIIWKDKIEIISWLLYYKIIMSFGVRIANLKLIFLLKIFLEVYNKFFQQFLIKIFYPVEFWGVSLCLNIYAKLRRKWQRQCN